MMFKRKDEASSLCVVQVSLEVLAQRGTVITDCNAASDYSRFLAPSQSEVLDFDDIYALDWRHPNNPARFYQHKSRKCAEVLVPHRVETRFLTGAYVIDEDARARLVAENFRLPVTIDKVLFFR